MAKTTSNIAQPSFPKEKPTIRLDENDVPGLKNWTIDQEVTVTVKAKVTNLGRREWDNDKRLWATLEIQNVSDAKDGDADNDAIADGMDSVKATKVARK